MNTGPGPLSQVDVDAIEDPLPDVDDHPGAEDQKLLSHEEPMPS